MNWIKENKFLAALCGGTLAGIIVLFFVGSHGSGIYQTAMDDYTAAADEVSGFEKSALYPTPEHRDAKGKALKDYSAAVETLQEAFQPFRPADMPNVSPQEFTDRLLEVNAETRKAFEEKNVIVPEPYFAGFEKYKTSLASGGTTGLLGYELGAIRNIMLALAAAGPSELKNVYRPELAEESGKTYEPGDAVARPFPLEVTFVGPEKSARDFISAITKLDEQFTVIRTLRIRNEKTDPPRASDAQCEKPPEPAAAADDVFGGGFVLPGEELDTGEEAPAEEAAEAPVVEEAPVSENTGRILSQVLGAEQVQVFVRLDVLQFLPAKKLP